MSSSQSICCELRSSKPKTKREIICGWDRFNALGLAVLIVFFGCWCLAYFVLYEPLPEHHHHHQQQDHRAHSLQDRDGDNF